MEVDRPRQRDKRVAGRANLRFTGLGKPKSRFCSQIGHFASDALSSDLNLRTSTHDQMKAELELFPAVSIVPGVFAVVQSDEIKPFPLRCLMSLYITFDHQTFRPKVV